MNNDLYLKVSGSIFALVTLGHLTRLTLQVPVQVGTWTVPLWPSVIGAVVTLLLCVWAFRSLNRE